MIGRVLYTHNRHDNPARDVWLIHSPRRLIVHLLCARHSTVPVPMKHILMEKKNNTETNEMDTEFYVEKRAAKKNRTGQWNTR